MSKTTREALAWLPFDCCEVENKLTEMCQSLAHAKHNSVCKQAADRLQQLKYAIRSVVLAVDKELAQEPVIA